MTGYGAATGPIGSWTATVELRSVNHRFFTPTIKLPPLLGACEGDVREALRQTVARGHVTCSVRLDGGALDAPTLDEARFGAAVERLRALRDRFDLAGEIDVATVLRLPNVIGGESESLPEGAAAALATLVRQAADALAATRRQEGARLGQVIAERLAVTEGAMARVAERAPLRVAAARERLRQAVVDATQGIALDEGRLAQEIAVLADRFDVGEELDRYATHVAAFRAALTRADGEPVGKRLGFLLQEMLREANTTGSKANDAAIQREVIAVKEELERIREQVENLE